ncbi:unnamed protein product [Bursaphelenchus okinawaensis]|uniref:DH domain-containing protein n=1 Tax=Bursaphelenchus okinawaensis TaxID=465554 RepID=A0A811JSM8_9BILA|nr:unnamed protein product [Bursaphelenchus okinawaensis]CAG9081013.1 unnamed protein product [Bursaphelenchus okinawaensis]
MTGDVSSNKQDEHQNQQSSSEMVLNQQERLEMGSDMKMEPEADSNIQSSAEVMKNQVSGYEIDSNNESTQKMAYSDESTLYLASNHESTSNLASSRESPFDLASDNDATPKMTSYQESEMGRFLRELLENHDEEHPSEPMLSPDELLEPSFFGYRDNAEDHFEEDLLDRTEPELAQTAPSPSLVARSLAKSLEERPLEGFNIHLTPFSLPDYYTLSTVGSSQRPDPPSTSSHATNLTNSRSPPSPIRTQPKRRYQRRGTVKLHNWNRSVSNDRSEDHHRPRALFDINDKLASPPNEPIYMNRSGVTRRISMRQKQAQSVIIMDEQSFSGDESSPSPHTMLKDARCGSLPSMNINSEGEETQDTNTWSSTYEKDNIGFSDPLVTSSIFRSDSNSNSIGDFQVLNIPNESDEYSSKVSSPVEEDNRPPHSAPPNMEDNTHFTFERRKSMIQELPAISEDLREEERPPSACSSTENDNTFHKRSTSDYILDKKEASPPLVKRNSIQETKDKPRLRIISGNPNGNGDHVDGKHETTMNKTYDLPYSPHEDKNMILKQNGSKKLHLVESQKRGSMSQTISSPMPTPHRFDINALTPRRCTIQKKKKKTKSRQPGRGIASATDFVDPSLLHGVGNSESLLSALAEIPEATQPVIRTDRDKKSGMSFTFWSIRHKKKLQKDARSTNSISPGRSDLDLKRASFAEFGAHMSPKVSDEERQRKNTLGPNDIPTALSQTRRISGSLADIEQFHAHFKNQQTIDEEEEDIYHQHKEFPNLQTPRIRLDSPEKSVYVPDGVVVTHERCFLPPVWVQPASPSREDARPLFQPQDSIDRPGVEEHEPRPRRRRTSSVSKSPTISDQLILHNIQKEKIKMDPFMLSTDSLESTAGSGSSFYRWPSLRKKKAKSCKTKPVTEPKNVARTYSEKYFNSVGHKRNLSLADGGSVRIRVLPDTLAKVLGSHNSSIDLRSLSEEEPINWPLLEKPKWEDLRIWDDIDDSWSSRHPTIHLPHSEAKRQNVIYELHATETRHCRVLIYLQQVFQAGLLIKKVLPPNDVKSIIPDVLDSLLDFHLQFLRRIRTRIAENPVVRTISDIVVDEFRNGENRAAAVNAYTEFCLASNEADKRYEDLMNKNSRFKLFIDEIDRNLVYSRSMNFKSCFLLVTQRLTKYPMLIEQILKYEEGEDKNLSLRACAAVKGFASRVDKELSTHMLNKRFDKIRNMIEKTSKGNLLDEEFTYDDLITSGDTYRKILSIGTVTWKSATHQSHELIMLLFDDIIVFLQGRNDVLYFFQQKDHASVLPLKATLVREMPRSNEVMLIVIDQKKPDMYRLSFNSKSEMTQWVHALKSANNNAPKFVRTASRLMFVEGSRSSTSQDNSNEESQYTEDLDKWHNELDKLYADRKNRDSKLEEYMEEHMQFLDGIREHVSKFPVRPTIENGSNSVRQKEMKEIVKMKNLLKAKFADLRTHRRAKFDKLIERAEKARDSDLPSYYDEVYELSHPGGFESATFSSSDENSPSTSERCRKPRRVRTYHGEEDSKHQNVRRHTTVPHVYDNEDETEAEKLIDQEIMRLPLKVNQKSRKAATDLIRENIRLRLENDRLRDENALTNIHLTALKARKNPFAETAEKLESLRQKQEEVQNKEVLFKKEYEKRMDALKMMEEELKAKEAELRQRELEMANNNQSFSSLPTESPASPIAESPRPDLNRETSFRLGAAILDNHKPTMIPRSTQSATDVVPRHLASKSETKLDKTKKKK